MTRYALMLGAVELAVVDLISLLKRLKRGLAIGPVNLYYQESHQTCDFTNSKFYLIHLTPH